MSGLIQSYSRPFLEPFAEGINGGMLAVIRGGAALLWRMVLSGVLFLVAAMGAVLFLSSELLKVERSRECRDTGTDCTH